MGVMPELPEVESVRRQLAPHLVGRTVVAVWTDHQARFDGVERCVGSRIEDLARRGKYLIAGLGGGHAPRQLIMHLGMTGSFRVRGRDGWVPDPYVRATLTLDDGVVDFRDVRRFGRLSVVEGGDHRRIATLAGLGPEPLSDAFTVDAFAAALARTRMPVKPFLLTQRPVAGVGNIYADEVLWRARIDPRSRRVGPARAARLHRTIREVIAEAIEREGTTFRDYQMVNGESGRNAAFLVAYGQEGRPCPRCGQPMVKIVLGGRGTTYCSACQRI